MIMTALRIAILLTLPLAVCCRPAASSSASRFRARDRWLVDDFGRVRLFHGFNSVNKGHPYYFPQILNRTQLEWYQRWGFNAVRLGAMWNGAQPVRQGEFDESYINVLEKATDMLGQYGMHVLFDMHQDVLSSKFEAYDGVPRWLIDRLPPSPLPYPWPFHNSTFPPDMWGLGYVTKAVGLAFQQIYNNVAGARDAMAQFWTKIASVFADRPNVLGYELMNEPWAGDVFEDPSLLLSGNAGRRNLGPFYNALNDAIRRVDNRTLIFYEPVTWSVFLSGNSSKLGIGFETVPGGDEYRDRSVLSYHYYCWVLSTHTHVPYVSWQRVLCDGLVGPTIMPTVLQEISRVGGSAFLTEFGICSPDGDPSSVSTIECNFMLDQADTHIQSWTYWDSTFFYDNGSINWNVVKSFARVYAQAVSGVPVYMTFNLASHLFHLKWIIDPAIPAPTEVFVPQLHYPRGFVVNVSPGLDWVFDASKYTLYISNTSIKNSTTVFVDISPI